MAIKISGTTVIDNSRNLVNVGGLKTVDGNSILGTGDITAGASQSLGTAQYTAYSSTYNITLTSTTITGTSIPYFNATTSGYGQLLQNIPAPPSTGVVTHYDFVYTNLVVPQSIPRPNDQGGPYTSPFTVGQAKVRTEYRTIA